MLYVPIQIAGQEKISGDIHLVLVLEGDRLYGYLLAFIEIVRISGYVLSQGRAGNGHHAKNGGRHAKLLQCTHHLSPLRFEVTGVLGCIRRFLNVFSQLEQKMIKAIKLALLFMDAIEQPAPLR